MTNGNERRCVIFNCSVIRMEMWYLTYNAIFAAQLLGFDNFIPPHANTSGSNILLGVNYASGAAGIRKETGTHLVWVMLLHFRLCANYDSKS